jgi:hypothetical protein
MAVIDAKKKKYLDGDKRVRTLKSSGSGSIAIELGLLQLEVASVAIHLASSDAHGEDLIVTKKRGLAVVKLIRSLDFDSGTDLNIIWEYNEEIIAADETLNIVWANTGAIAWVLELQYIG